MLEVRQLDSYYAYSQALFSVDLDLQAGEVVTLLGRNGMGKTTLVRSIMGLAPRCTGSIRFDGQNLLGRASYAIARAGIGLVPEGRQIFPNLSARENLIATASNHTGQANPWTVERVFGLFPELEERAQLMGNLLSGGEQQMLAIGRALMTNPKLLILDEATEGLAPLVRAEIWGVLEELKARSQSILIIDKNLDALLRIADRHYLLENGHLVWRGDSRALAEDGAAKARYLGV